MKIDIDAITFEDIQKELEKENIPFGEFSNLLLATEKDEVLGYCLFDIEL